MERIEVVSAGGPSGGAFEDVELLQAERTKEVKSKERRSLDARNAGRFHDVIDLPPFRLTVYLLELGFAFSFGAVNMWGKKIISKIETKDKWISGLSLRCTFR